MLSLRGRPRVAKALAVAQGRGNPVKEAIITGLPLPLRGIAMTE